MVRNFKTQLAGDGVLAVFYLGVKKFFHMAAVQAHQMVMVLAIVELVEGFAPFKLAAGKQPGLLKLG
jgi:hypothetical protein